MRCLQSFRSISSGVLKILLWFWKIHKTTLRFPRSDISVSACVVSTNLLYRGFHVIHRADDLQIAFFFIFCYFGQPQLHHRTPPDDTTPRWPHRINDSILLPRQHRSAAIFLHPQTIASPSSSFSSRRHRRAKRRNLPQSLSSKERLNRVCKCPDPDRYTPPFLPTNGRAWLRPPGLCDPDICIRGL